MADNPFFSENIPDLVPEGDVARQAVELIARLRVPGSGERVGMD